MREFNKRGAYFLGAGLLVNLLLTPLQMAFAEADRLYLYNGETVTGKMYDCNGEMLQFKTGMGSRDFFTRLQLASRLDKVYLRGKKSVVEGEILYVDPFKLEIATERGRFKLWRLKIDHLEMGLPRSQPEE